MNKMNLGQLISLIHCKGCGTPIEIYPHQESIKCVICNKEINLVYDFGFDITKNNK